MNESKDKPIQPVGQGMPLSGDAIAIARDKAKK